jgi:hypothetical protein
LSAPRYAEQELTHREQAVCVKYQSFVCDMCKSAHQSFSHRTKSVTMSTWTMEEVKALDERNGGGNEWCRAKWFARLSDSEEQRWMPKEGDPLDNFKRFVHMAYEDSKWYDASAKPAAAGSSTSAPRAASEPAKSAIKAPQSATKKPPKQAEEDLLILDFESTVTVSATPTPPAVMSSGSSAVASPAVDEWGTFVAPSPQLAASKAAPSLSDDWTFQSAPPLPTQSSAPSAMPLLNNLSQLYQPQAPAGHNILGALQGPGKPIMAGSIAPAPFAQPQLSIASDPFAQLHSYASAPAYNPLNRASSATNGNAAPTGLMPPVQRASSAPVTSASDPFAGLI